MPTNLKLRCGFLYGAADAHISGAAAEIAVHRIVDIVIGRVRIVFEQCDR